MDRGRIRRRDGEREVEECEVMFLGRGSKEGGRAGGGVRFY